MPNLYLTFFKHCDNINGYRKMYFFLDLLFSVIRGTKDLNLGVTDRANQHGWELGQEQFPG